MTWAAGLLVPGSERQVWRERKLDEARQYRAFLRERGESPAVIREKLRSFCRQALQGAFRQRFPEADLRAEATRFARSPVFFTAVTSLLLLGLTLSTGLFSALRAIYGPLPYPDAGRLAACYQVHFLALSWGVQARHVRPWQEQSKTLDGLAAYQFQNFAIALPGRPEISVGGARVTEEFFRVLGVKPA
ncbi:MAG TPA: hypothetical protein VLH09_14690, partial [Bryobacteraceae bacterium]|nr:hypothetical protein [Bryobacteraceae bacterium]